MMKLILATRNQDKIKEIKDLLQNLNVEILTLDRFPQIPEVVEDGDTLEQNALKKARTISEATQLFALADDTGLEVDFLNGAPGVYSSRYAGENASYDDNVNKLIQEMKTASREERTARFRCVIAITGPDFQQIVEGACEGYILDEKRGDKGFGYDPVFFVPEYQQTFAEMSLEQKNKISHRGQALQKARNILANLTG